MDGGHGHRGEGSALGRVCGEDHVVGAGVILGGRGIVFPDSTRLCPPPGRERVDPLLTSAKGGRRTGGRNGKSAREVLKREDLINACPAGLFDDGVRGGSRDAWDGDGHLQKGGDGSRQTPTALIKCSLGCVALG